MSRKTKRIKTSSYIIAGIISVIVIAGGVFAVVALGRQNQQNSPNNDTSNNPQETPRQEIDPTNEEEVAVASADVKELMDQELEKTTETAKTESGLKKATPMIGYVAEDDEFIIAGGTVPGTNETEGVCTYVFTNGANTISEQSSILPGPQYITCGALRIEKSRLSKGSWSVKLQYKSKISEGESETQTIEIK